jgi:hypothetical protein
VEPANNPEVLRFVLLVFAALSLVLVTSFVIYRCYLTVIYRCYILYTGVIYYIQVLLICNIICIEVLAYYREEYTSAII